MPSLPSKARLVQTPVQTRISDGDDEAEDGKHIRLSRLLRRSAIRAGVPQFSPHDLRHRRVSLLHLGGMPWARIGELVGHDDLITTARTYTHVVAEEGELDYAAMLS